MLSAEVKNRRESAEIYTGGGAGERAAIETSEADLIESYLPAAISLEQLDTIVADATEATGASTVKDTGRVDGKALSEHVRNALTDAPGA